MPSILDDHHLLLRYHRPYPRQATRELSKGHEHIHFGAGPHCFCQRDFLLQDLFSHLPQQRRFSIMNRCREVPNTVIKHVHPWGFVVKALALGKDETEARVVLHGYFRAGLHNHEKAHLKEEEGREEGVRLLSL